MMKKETLMKTLDCIKEYNNDLWKLVRKVYKIQKNESKSKKVIESEVIQEILILISVLLSGNIKVRYDLEEYINENKAFASLATLKSISSNCKQDIEGLKSLSFNMVEILKTIKQKENEVRYKEETL